MSLSSADRLRWQKLLEDKIAGSDLGNDPAHDLAHFRRVSQTASHLCEREGGNLDIVMPAAWLHDLVNVPKNDPRRSLASRLSAEAAIEFLLQQGYPETLLPQIAHAIEAHSFSAKIEPRSLEAAIVQDADRLDGLGAIGIARCFAVAGLLKRPLYHPEDPFGTTREFNDLDYTLDHFFVKLFKVAETLRTQAGREEGTLRVQTMRNFLTQLGREISPQSLKG